MEDVAQHPQNRYVEVETPSGPVRCLAPGALVDRTFPGFGPVPGLAEHSGALRAEFAPRLEEQA